MRKKEYVELVKASEPKPRRMTNTVCAFLSGGLIGAIFETIRVILVNHYGIREDFAVSGLILFIIFLACLFTTFFDFDKWVVKFKAGLIVPITGFAHSIQSSALDYKKDGAITGLGANFFKLAGSVILYGIISSFIFCILKVVFYG